MAQVSRAVVRASAEDLVARPCLPPCRIHNLYRQSSDCTTGWQALKDSNFLMQFSRSSPINGRTEITAKTKSDHLLTGLLYDGLMDAGFAHGEQRIYRPLHATHLRTFRLY